jgi:hypothetical protein
MSVIIQILIQFFCRLRALHKKLDDILVNNELGGMKLEHQLKKGIFIGSKTYGFITSDDQVIVKVKGFNSKKIKLNQLIKLLDPNELLIVNSQLFKKTSSGIEIINFNKKLTNTISHKRNIILKNGIIVDTYPLTIK